MRKNSKTIIIILILVLVYFIYPYIRFKKIIESTRGESWVTILGGFVVIFIIAILFYYIYKWLSRKKYIAEKEMSPKQFLHEWLIYPNSRWIIQTNFFKKIKNKYLRETLNIIPSIVINFIVYCAVFLIVAFSIYAIKLIVY